MIFSAYFLHYRTLFAILAIMCMTYTISGCEMSRTRQDVQPLQNTGPASIHHVTSEKLKEIMHSLKHEVFEPERNILDVDEELRRHAAGIAGTVKEMSGNIIELATKPPGLGLDNKEIRLFTAYAEQLGLQADEIGLIAKKGRLKMLNPAINRMVRTCNACHKRFRSIQNIP